MEWGVGDTPLAVDAHVHIRTLALTQLRPVDDLALDLEMAAHVPHIRDSVCA